VNSYSVHYKFSQHFDFPAKDAFDWSMDYDEGDIARFGKHGKRKIERINEDTLILTDMYLSGSSREVKRRLIRIYPELLTMVNTRLSETNRHSQFIYEFVPEGEKGSRLDFTGSHVFAGRKPSPSKIASLARGMAEEDAGGWRRLAAEMKKDLSKRAWTKS
jgi:hypothetical protein